MSLFSLMQISAELLPAIPEQLYTLITLGLMIFGILFLHAGIKNNAPDRYAKVVIGLLLLTIGLSSISLLWGLILR